MKMNHNIIQKSEKKCFFRAIYFIYIALIFIPIGFIGITCNDDLKWRLYASQGFSALAKAYFEAAKNEGRVLSCTQIVSLYLAMFPNMVLQGLAKVAFIFSNIWLIGRILKLFFANKVRALWMILMPLFLQVTLNHCPPDAFVAFVSFPMSMFLVSLICLDKYLRNRNKLTYVLSLICYFWAICSYEYFIVLSPLFLLVSWDHDSIELKNSIIVTVRNIWGHVITGALYLALYFLLRIVFPSNYQGNQLVFTRIMQSINVEWMIIKSGIPAGYYFSPKGLFLNSWGKELISTNTALLVFYYVRITLIITFASIMLFALFKLYDTHTNISKKQFIVTVLVCVYLICVLPMLNAFSLSWTSIEDYSDIMGTTVSYLISFAFLILLTVFACWINQRIRIVLLVIILVWGVFVQKQNMSYSYLQNMSYRRILNIENFLTNVGQERFLDNSLIFVEGIDQPYLMQCAPILILEPVVKL